MCTRVPHACVYISIAGQATPRGALLTTPIVIIVLLTCVYLSWDFAQDGMRAGERTHVAKDPVHVYPSSLRALSDGSYSELRHLTGVIL